MKTKNGYTMLWELVEAFIASISVAGVRSPSTIRNYELYLHRLLDFLWKDALVSDLTIERIEAFHASLLKRGLGRNTRSYYLIAIRSMLSWLAKRNITPPVIPSAIDLPKYQHAIRDVPSEEDIKKLLRVCHPQHRLHAIPIKQCLRNRSIIEMLLSSGMRLNELTSLKIEDIDFKNKQVTIIGKGEKPRLVFFSSDAAYFLGLYLERRTDKNPYLFIERDHNAEGPISHRSVQRMLTKYCQVAGTKEFSPHQFRHFFATKALEGGANLFDVKEFLGHTNINTTALYLHVSNKHLQEIHKRIFRSNPATRRTDKSKKRETRLNEFLREGIPSRL